MEGNIWWLGSKRANWEAVMGKSVWWWFCECLGLAMWSNNSSILPPLVPIGHSEGDGLTFPVNPRFSEDGVWMPKRDWPLELQ